MDVLISDAMAKAIPSHGTVLDRSVGGLRLLVTNPLTEGKIYSVRPVKGNVVTPWIQVEIRSCQEGSDGWEVGCQFLRTPPSTVLWQFG